MHNKGISSNRITGFCRSSFKMHIQQLIKIKEHEDIPWWMLHLLIYNNYHQVTWKMTTPNLFFWWAGRRAELNLSQSFCFCSTLNSSQVIDICPLMTFCGSSSLTTCGSADIEIDWKTRAVSIPLVCLRGLTLKLPTSDC